MPITYRFRQRQAQLEQPFQKIVLKNLWKTKVKNQMRSMPILDLHDFYDFHRRLDENASKINEQILSGQYKVQTPTTYTLEKKLGICRHMIILSPSDTLILQALIQPFCHELEKLAPSKKAYYSRDKSSAIKLPHEIDTSSGNWFSKWKLYQKEILHFTNTKKYIIVTDISNYYDSIRLKELRSVISGYIQCDEVLLDLIFDTIENLSWRPDYLPSYAIGIPVINLEAIRLLAHSFLFEIDSVLKQQVKEHFLRWMDDIIIGVDDIKEAKQTLRCISDVLKSRGLALNMAKTCIFSSEEARRHFLFDENTVLNNFSEIRPSEQEFMKHFTKHWKQNRQYRYYDKVLKRYLTIAGDCNFTKILRYLPEIFETYSDLRTNICSYLYKLGFNKKTANTFLSLINISRYDDITLFLLVSLVTDWNIGQSKYDKKFLDKISQYLKSLQLQNQEFNFYSYLWFAAKYENCQQLYDYLNKYRNFWIRSSFLTRQVSAVLTRLLPNLQNEYNKLCEFIIQRDYNDASSVIHNINEIRTTDTTKYLKEYLFPKNKHKKGYPLPKFLILYDFYLNDKVANNSNLNKEIAKHIEDKWFLYWIQNIKKSISDS